MTKRAYVLRRTLDGEQSYLTMSGWSPSMFDAYQMTRPFAKQLAEAARKDFANDPEFVSRGFKVEVVIYTEPNGELP